MRWVAGHTSGPKRITSQILFMGRSKRTETDQMDRRFRPAPRDALSNDMCQVYMYVNMLTTVLKPYLFRRRPVMSSLCQVTR
jgi:hypothetical protein